MKINEEIQDAVKRETDVDYKQASEMYEEKAKKAVIAKMDIERDLNAQTTNFKMRLAQRKKQIELRRSGFLDEDDCNSNNLTETGGKVHPKSTRSIKQSPGFGGIQGGMLAELNIDHLQHHDANKSNELLQQLQMRPQPFSTKARDHHTMMMENGKKVMFPGEADMADDEEINDISGIVNDISNIEDTSFQITIDALNPKRLGPGPTANGTKPRLQINTCKYQYLSC